MQIRTRQVLYKAIEEKCAELQELMQDYLAGDVPSEVREDHALLMLALDSINGNDDPCCAIIELFAPEYPDHDISNPEVFYNRKILANYVKFNCEKEWE